MAFADPQTVTIAGAGNTLARTSSVGSKSIYMKNDENLSLEISHSKSRDRIRSFVKYDQRVVAADVLTAENKFQTATVSIMFDRPLVGFTATQIKDLWAAIKTHIDNAAVDKVYGQET